MIVEDRLTSCVTVENVIVAALLEFDLSIWHGDFSVKYVDVVAGFTPRKSHGQSWWTVEFFQKGMYLTCDCELLDMPFWKSR